MSLDQRGLHFTVTDFLGTVHFYGTAKTKLAILTFLYCGVFVKTSIDNIVKDTVVVHMLFRNKGDKTWVKYNKKVQNKNINVLDVL